MFCYSLDTGLPTPPPPPPHTSLPHPHTYVLKKLIPPSPAVNMMNFLRATANQQVNGLERQLVTCFISAALISWFSSLIYILSARDGKL